MNKTNLLKKFLLGVVCIMVAFSFVGCSGKNNAHISNEENKKETVPMAWDEETRNKIKQDYLTQFVIPNAPNAIVDNLTADDVVIKKHHGTYNGYFVITTNYDTIEITQVNIVIIGNVEFNFSIYVIKVWKNGNFYTLQETYEQKYLTQADLEKIAESHRAFLDEERRNDEAN
jgi:hypothetical protein